MLYRSYLWYGRNKYHLKPHNHNPPKCPARAPSRSAAGQSAMSATATARRVRSAGRFAVRNGAPDGDGRNRRKRGGKGAPWRSGLPDRFTPAPISPRRLWRSRRTLCRTDNRRNRSPSRSAAGRFAIRNGAPDCDGCNRAGDLSGNRSPFRSRRTRCAVKSPPDRFGHNRRKRDGNRPPWRSDLPDRFAPVPICRRVPVSSAVCPVAFRQSAAPPSAMSRTGSDTVRAFPICRTGSRPSRSRRAARGVPVRRLWRSRRTVRGSERCAGKQKRRAPIMERGATVRKVSGLFLRGLLRGRGLRRNLRGLLRRGGFLRGLRRNLRRRGFLRRGFLLHVRGFLFVSPPVPSPHGDAQGGKLSRPTGAGGLTKILTQSTGTPRTSATHL